MLQLDIQDVRDFSVPIGKGLLLRLPLLSSRLTLLQFEHAVLFRLPIWFIVLRDFAIRLCDDRSLIF